MVVLYLPFTIPYSQAFGLQVGLKISFTPRFSEVTELPRLRLTPIPSLKRGVNEMLRIPRFKASSSRLFPILLSADLCYLARPVTRRAFLSVALHQHPTERKSAAR